MNARTAPKGRVGSIHRSYLKHARQGQPLAHPQASTTTLAHYFVEGPYTVPPPAKAALSSRLISASDITTTELATRAQARIDELTVATAAVLGLLEVVVALNLTQPVSS